MMQRAALQLLFQRACRLWLRARVKVKGRNHCGARTEAEKDKVYRVCRVKADERRIFSQSGWNRGAPSFIPFLGMKLFYI